MHSVPSPLGKFIVECRWVYTIEVGSDRRIDCLKTRLVAKGNTLVFDYTDTFSHVAKMAYVYLFLSVAIVRHCIT